MKTLVFSLIVISTLIIASSCSSFQGSKDIHKISAEEKKGYEGKDIDQTIEEGHALIKKAVEDKLDYYAPQHLQRAREILKEAKEIIKSKDQSVFSKLSFKEKLTEDQKKDMFFTKILLSKKYIQGGYKTKKLVLKEMDEVFKLKEQLIDLKAAKEYPSDYEDIVERIDDMIKEMEEEQEKFEYEKRSELLTDIKALKAKIVIKYALKETRKILSKIRDKEYDEIAPKTYNEAIKTFNASEKFIKKYTDDDKGVKKASTEALFAANHSYYVAKEVIRLQNIIGNDEQDMAIRLENVVLEQEKHLLLISQSMKIGDVRDRSLKEQSVTIANAAEAMVGKKEGKKMPVKEEEPKKKE